MKISLVTVSNFKRIKDVTISPAADRGLILIAGKNAQGKTSLFDAIETALGGKKFQPADPVRHGADEAKIVIEFDGGDLIARRTIQPNGDSHLEVRDRMGARKAPQEILDAIIGARFLDPLKFIALPAKEQRAQLMRLIPEADRIGELDEKRERAATKRTEVGRDKTKAVGSLALLEERPVAKPIDVAELTAEAKRLTDQQRELDTMRRDHAESSNASERERRHLASLQAEIEQLEARLVDLKNTAKTAVGVVAKCEQFERDIKATYDAAAADLVAGTARANQVDADLKRADEHNRAVFAAEAHNKRRTETAESVAALTAEYDNITKVIETINQRKADILGKAKLPIEGLGVDDNGITLNGVAFAQASRAEQVRVALGLATAASPKLADVWIRDGAVLDEDSLAQVEAHVTSTGHCVWVERVGTGDAGAIIFSDGGVAS